MALCATSEMKIAVGIVSNGKNRCAFGDVTAHEGSFVVIISIAAK
jgi:hypothetical protein